MRRNGPRTICGAFLLLFGLSTGLVGKERLPVATGEYQIILGGRRIGQEQFSIFRDKTYIVQSTATLYWPEPTRIELRYELGVSFQPKKLEVEVARAGQFTKMELKHRRDDWRVEIKGKGRKKVRQDLGSRAGTEVDFDSPLFKAFILRRLSLKPGEQREVDTIVLQLSDLKGERRQQTCRGLDAEEIESQALGMVQASTFELAIGEITHQLWTDSTGVVLLSRAELPEGKLEYELVRLDSKPGAWQPPSR